VFIHTNVSEKNFSFVAISQRDSENYYDFIGPIADEIVANIVGFFNNHIQNKFLSDKFVVDIYRKDSVRFFVFI
jgi:hypothetical protein